MSESKTSSSSGPRPGMKICPYCAEEIREAAVKCRFCHSYLTANISQQPAGVSAADADVEPATGLDEQSTRKQSSAPLPPPPSPKPRPKPAATKSARTARSKQRQPAARTRFPALAKPVVTIALSVLVVLLLAADAFLLLSYHGYREQADARSSGQVSAVNDIEKILSYDYRSFDKGTKEAEALMTPKFKKKYADTVDAVRADARPTKAVVKAQVVASSVVSAKKDKVKALLFVNQTTTRTNLAQPRVDLNRVEVTLVRDGDDWRVDNIQAL
jgi:Mce-associated membrane protein